MNDFEHPKEYKIYVYIAATLLLCFLSYLFGGYCARKDMENGIVVNRQMMLEKSLGSKLTATELKEMFNLHRPN